MVIDIVKFFFIYSLVLFAFACGLNQLLWYFSDLEKQKCYHLPNGEPDFDGAGDACMKWRRFANVFESSQSLFWASFGMVDLSSFELTGIKTYTRFWGLLMFGSYSVINVIVLLNLLIAMMSNSYAMIDEHSDTEWKFARTKLWMSYFDETGTLPPPFNIFPKPKNFFKLLGLRKKDKMRRMSTKRRNREERERDYRYTAVMRALVWRYVSSMHRKSEESMVSEDDVNELKSDISTFRYELLDVLGKNGMDISSAQRKEKAVLGKKMKVWERRLMKDFKVAPVALEEGEELFAPPENENSLARFRRVARLAILDSGINKWRQVIRGAQIASQIGHCHTRNSLKKQQNLQRAMDEAKKLSSKSPLISRSNTPIMLPDMTGSEIVNVIKRGADKPEQLSEKSVPLSPNVTIMQKQLSTSPSPPAISIDPPAFKLKVATLLAPQNELCLSNETFTSEEEPNLINLDSAKSSPVPSIKKSTPSSINSLYQILDNSDIEQSTEHQCSTSRITSPPIIVLPPSMSPSRHSLNSKDSLDSQGSLKLKRNGDEEMERPSSPIPGYYGDENQQFDELSEAVHKLPKEIDELGSRKRIIGKITNTEQIAADENIGYGNQLVVKDDHETNPVTINEVGAESVPAERTKIIENIIEPELFTNELSTKYQESKSIEKTDTTSPAKTLATAPLTRRNIQLIHDAKRVQPRYGWL